MKMQILQHSDRADEFFSGTKVFNQRITNISTFWVQILPLAAKAFNRWKCKYFDTLSADKFFSGTKVFIQRITNISTFWVQILPLAERRPSIDENVNISIPWVQRRYYISKQRSLIVKMQVFQHWLQIGTDLVPEVTSTTSWFYW